MATLKQIGEIYNECLQAIRSQPLEGFDEEVTAWLKNARYQIMKDIEEKYDGLIPFYLLSLTFSPAFTSWSNLYINHYFAHCGLLTHPNISAFSPTLVLLFSNLTPKPLSQISSSLWTTVAWMQPSHVLKVIACSIPSAYISNLPTIIRPLECPRMGPSLSVMSFLQTLCGIFRNPCSACSSADQHWMLVFEKGKLLWVCRSFCLRYPLFSTSTILVVWDLAWEMRSRWKIILEYWLLVRQLIKIVTMMTLQILSQFEYM